MSVLNIWLSPNKALIGVDTKGLSLDGSQREVGKMFPIVHANTILAGRGHMPFLGTVSAMIHSMSGNFDGIAERMPSILPHAFSMFLAEMTRDGFDPTNGGEITLHGQEVVLVGWSPKQGRMVCMGYRQKSGDAGFVVNELAWSVSPWDASQGAPCKPQSMEAQEHLAREQARHFNDPFGRSWIGGRLLVAEITRDIFTITSRCDLDAPQSPNQHLELGRS